jgi:hypothetical protein
VTGADIQNMTAVDIFARAIAMHPTTFLEALHARAWDDSRYAATRDNAAIKRAVMASFDASIRACDMVRAENPHGFACDMGAGIIALGIACKLQCLPAHIRTQAGVTQWGD